MTRKYEFSTTKIYARHPNDFYVRRRGIDAKDRHNFLCETVGNSVSSLN